jgi:brefeldin A-inhibited guanine nucleotide-exchange protein
VFHQNDLQWFLRSSVDAPPSAILPAPLHPEVPLSTDLPNPLQARRRIFQQIIVKCVLQLLLIETTYELLQNNSIYETMPADQLLRLMGVLDHSYQFARSFNEDKDLRTGLWRVGASGCIPMFTTSHLYQDS